MSTQSEAELEAQLISDLESLGYESIRIKNEAALLANLKKQLEKHNHKILDGGVLTDLEFKNVLNHLDKGTVFDRAVTLRGKMQILREGGELLYLEFINQQEWCKNEYQVTNQITMEGTYTNRYDVTILINGLPLVQIELKKRGLGIKEAFNQIGRYHNHTYTASKGIFMYVQLFIISNGVNTKYFANNKEQNFKQTFYWSDVENAVISSLSAFTPVFLEPCHLSKMITQYIVLSTKKTMMVLRGYQYYAVEKIIEHAQTSTQNGYIWHTTGSGKTLTSFKASQLLMNFPSIFKVVFVVDRKDLDAQTVKEFNNFSEGSVDGTEDTRHLVQQFSNDNTRLIVTTIQKLNNAINNGGYLTKMEKLKDKKVVFIFDECHRSQFGDTHRRITKFFTNHQMFGFTGTPILEDNAYKIGKHEITTETLFKKNLHKYVIPDAIKDDNVLKFSIEYVLKETDSINEEDTQTKQQLASPLRLEKITDYIISNHDKKTHNRAFTAMFCVNNIETLIKYYDLFKQKEEGKEKPLKVVTVFSYAANAEEKNTNGYTTDDDYYTIGTEINATHREKLDEYIMDYNKMFGTNFSTKVEGGFYGYSQDVSARVKNKEIDILIVVNMFLTGFDSPRLNTLYVDKNLKYHGLIQAFSRTNRILDERKSQGNIVCFRNLKTATDEAITLFSNKNAIDTVLMLPYEDYLKEFQLLVAKLKAIAPTVDSIDTFASEVEKEAFVKAFRELIRKKNVLGSFADFDFADLDIAEQEFEDYKSKYLDIYDATKVPKEKEEEISLLDELDFELELIHKDEINVTYILSLLYQLKEKEHAQILDIKQQIAQMEQRKSIIDMMMGESSLRPKRELVEKFINEDFATIKNAEEIDGKFQQFWDKEKQEALEKLCNEEDLIFEKLSTIISKRLYTNRKPLNDDIVKALNKQPSILSRRTTAERIISKIEKFISLFIDGIAL